MNNFTPTEPDYEVLSKRIMTFGKYEGCRFEDLDASYIYFLISRPGTIKYRSDLRDWCYHVARRPDFGERLIVAAAVHQASK
jgi:hypothetical protein